jgi:hypothetical protein
MKTYLLDNIDEMVKEACEIGIPWQFRQLIDDWQEGGTCCGSAPYYRFLNVLCKHLCPRTAVELGTWLGLSSAYMSVASPSTRIITIDCNSNAYKLDKSMYPNVEVIVGDSSVIPVLNPPIENVDLLFIDTEHNGTRPKLELDIWKPLLSNPCVVLFDDIDLNQDMKDFWASLTYLKYSLPILHQSGFGVAIVETA